MKYGLVIYEKTDNIGDDIQSYAAMCQLPKVDYLIDREHMDTFAPEQDDEQIAVIMNGWFLHNRFNWPPSPYIYPLFLSMHFTQRGYIIQGDSFLRGIGGDFLKKYGPVGVRDENSLEVLKELGIEAYHSACMTLTLPGEESVERGDEILLVDLKDDQVEYIRENYSDENIDQITHTLTEKDYEPWEQRLDRVKKLLSRYQSAKCVITSRLHCALPCLALGTPVLMVYEDDFADRIGSFLKLLHYCTSENFKSEVELYIKNPLENKQDYIEYREDLIQRCQDFIQQTSQVDLVGEVPPLAIFKTYWQEKAIWQEEILDQQIQVYRDTIEQLRNWAEEQDKVKSWHLSQIDGKDARIHEMEEWAAELERAKDGLADALQNQKEWTAELERTKDFLDKHSKSEEAARVAAEERCKTEETAKAAAEDALQKQMKKTELLEKEKKQLERKLQQLTNDKMIQFIIKRKHYQI